MKHSRTFQTNWHQKNILNKLLSSKYEYSRDEIYTNPYTFINLHTRKFIANHIHTKEKH